MMNQLECSLGKFTYVRDSLPETSEMTVESTELDEYSTRVEDCLATTIDYVMNLQARIRSIRSCEAHTRQHGFIPSQQEHGSRRAVGLPTLPDIPELFKFNYLLDALQSEAEGSVKKFQITKENYYKAISLLQNRYGAGEEILQKLINRLEYCNLRSDSIKDQLSLFEQLQVTIQQLAHKEAVQRKVLLKKRSLLMENHSFGMEDLLTLLEDVISGEEMKKEVAEDKSVGDKGMAINNEPGDCAVLGVQPSGEVQVCSTTFLPIGELKVVNPATSNLCRVKVLIDTGAEISFIDGKLADELQLPVVEERNLRYYTFGSEQIHVKKSRKVQLPVWDNENQFHILSLLTSDVLTKTFALFIYLFIYLFI
ncbi:unnamed protein product [Heligmosomoides polygyrus]|uniref:Peptidase A2 domain-containing protein n=1 Tax=Heligmosomoides polygyrus TaxID=6339 RepID=A0A183GE60_HELPZ|nr:unnamed protein product [Heligmosomoides polygyrus]